MLPIRRSARISATLASGVMIASISAISGVGEAAGLARRARHRVNPRPSGEDERQREIIGYPFGREARKEPEKSTAQSGSASLAAEARAPVA